MDSPDFCAAWLRINIVLFPLEVVQAIIFWNTLNNEQQQQTQSTVQLLPEKLIT